MSIRKVFTTGDNANRALSHIQQYANHNYNNYDDRYLIGQFITSIKQLEFYYQTIMKALGQEATIKIDADIKSTNSQLRVLQDKQSNSLLSFNQSLNMAFDSVSSASANISINNTKAANSYLSGQSAYNYSSSEANSEMQALAEKAQELINTIVDVTGTTDGINTAIEQAQETAGTSAAQAAEDAGGYSNPGGGWEVGGGAVEGSKGVNDYTSSDLSAEIEGDNSKANAAEMMADAAAAAAATLQGKADDAAKAYNEANAAEVRAAEVRANSEAAAAATATIESINGSDTRMGDVPAGTSTIENGTITVVHNDNGTTTVITRTDAGDSMRTFDDNTTTKEAKESDISRLEAAADEAKTAAQEAQAAAQAKAEAQAAADEAKAEAAKAQEEYNQAAKEAAETQSTYGPAAQAQDSMSEHAGYGGMPSSLGDTGDSGEGGDD